MSTLDELAPELAAVGRRLDQRGWLLGTSGNLSAVASRRPLRLAITSTGVWKGRLDPGDIVEIDENCRLVRAGDGRRASAEAVLHLEVVRRTGAGAVLHTHSVWSTIASEVHAPQAGLWIAGYEMLKGLAGVTTHEHREWVPILENDQDIPRLAFGVGEVLTRWPAAHGFLLRQHGLYTWGGTLDEATRHVEILEFLLEATTRAREIAGARRGRHADGRRQDSGRAPDPLG